MFALCERAGCIGVARDPIVGYARCLKDFILYMRYGVRTRRMRHRNLAAFRQACLDN